MRIAWITLLLITLGACVTTGDHAGEAPGDRAARIKNEM